MTEPWLGHLNGCSIQWSPICDCDPDAPVDFSERPDGEVPTDGQMREWFPKTFARIDDEVDELDAEERPDDDPAPTPTCNGRDCGGRPHE